MHILAFYEDVSLSYTSFLLWRYALLFMYIFAFYEEYASLFMHILAFYW